MKITFPKGGNRILKLRLTDSGADYFPQGDYVTNGHWLFHATTLAAKKGTFDKNFKVVFDNAEIGTWNEGCYEKSENPYDPRTILPKEEKLANYGEVTFSGIVIVASGFDQAIFWSKNKDYVFPVNREYAEFILENGFTLKASVEHEGLPLLVCSKYQPLVGVVMPCRMKDLHARLSELQLAGLSTVNSTLRAVQS